MNFLRKTFSKKGDATANGSAAPYNSYTVTYPDGQDGGNRGNSTLNGSYINKGYGGNGSDMEMNLPAAAGPIAAYDQNSEVQEPPGDTESENGEEEVERGEWGSKAEFILSCVGYSVGIGNVWRFPYLAYQNGGGAFLFPYVILLIFVGKPMYYLETAIGQFAKKSPVHVWHCAPLAKGVGIAQVILSLIVAIYYNVIMGYSIFYIGASFVGTYEELPWSYCGEWWGANENCTVTSNTTNATRQEMGLKRCYPELNIVDNCTYIQSSTAQFWEKYVLNITPYLSAEPGNLGGISYPLPLCLLLSWMVVFLCIMKGVQSSGKVVYFTATFPYVILLALLINGCLLDGASDGIYYLFVPQWDKLLDFQVWQKAAEQMFFSLGISWGGLMMFGSYNKFHNRVDFDAAIVSSLDFATSLIASVVIFSVLGNLSLKLGVPIENVADGGQGLAFVAYPEALSQLPAPYIWSILFFSMLFFLGLDSQFALLETATTVLYDCLPYLRKYKLWINLGSCVTLFLLGLPCVSYSGQYVLDIMDSYGAGLPVLFCAIFELVGLCWIYGFHNISKDIKLMIGHEPSWFWKLCWLVISPVFLIVIFLASVISWKELKYGQTIPYPEWAHIFGWVLVAFSAIQIPLYAIVALFTYGYQGNIWDAFKPTKSWGPGDPKVRREIRKQQQQQQQQLQQELSGRGNPAFDQGATSQKY